eukprot:CAMPEP_0172325592 /NCGR_PEP_ID=MMETSP1058-20130122/54448_1 /TAXON_ID=83371 /ORGANISM="Detonula confervacea, Strain CCMP 353" /LENGTH=64 /DNA_ID=CAMNT_0013042181 /DNA_START=107 /DNA_END=297 /DNA_ORIENTATION=-
MSSSTPNRRQSSRRQSSGIRPDATKHGKNDKTYVWVRLRDGSFSSNTIPRTGSNVANKKRGAPT